MAKKASTKATNTPADVPVKKDADTVAILFRDHKGEPTSRVFSLEVHGDDFQKLAQEFKETNLARIIA